MTFKNPALAIPFYKSIEASKLSTNPTESDKAKS